MSSMISLNFDLKLSEFVTMREFLLSPDELIEIRERLEREDDRIIH